MLYLILVPVIAFIIFIILKFLGVETGKAIVLTLAIINDLLDLGLIGVLPIIGDFYDIFMTFLIFATSKSLWSIPTLLELIPSPHELLPIHTVCTLLAYRGKLRKK